MGIEVSVNEIIFLTVFDMKKFPSFHASSEANATQVDEVKVNLFKM